MRAPSPSLALRAPSARARRMAATFTLVPWFLGSLFLVPTAHAAQWMDVATISNTLGNTVGRLCSGGGRTDIGCSANAPLLDTASGLLTVPGDLRVTGNLYISGSQQIDGVSFANGGISASGVISATQFTGSGAGLFGIPASAVTGLSTDRITSGTTGITTYGSGYISITTAGVTTGYFDTTGLLIAPGISITTANGISSTNGYFSNRIGIGSNPNPSSMLMIDVTSGGQSGLTINNLAGGGSPAIIRGFAMGNGGTAASPVAVTKDQILLTLNGSGYWTGKSSPRFEQGEALASIYLRSETDFTSTDRATAISFHTTPPSSTTVTERMRLRANGNLGIGTVNPLTKLDVVGTIRMADSGESCDANRLGALKYTSNQFYICRNGTSWETLIAGTSGSVDTDRITSGTTSIIAYNNASATIATNGVERLIVGTGGNVGIGQQPNDRALSVSGSVSFSNYMNTSSDVWTNTQTLLAMDGQSDATTNAMPRLTFATGAAHRASIQAARDASGDYNGYLSFSTRDNALAPYMFERMRIASNGNVGIGTTNPLVSLEVSVTTTPVIRVSGPDSQIKNLMIRSSGSGRTWGLSMRDSSVNDQFWLTSNNGSVWQDPILVATMDNKVGIGTASPSSTLHVSGTVRATQYCDFNGNNCGLPGSGGGSSGDRITSNSQAGVTANSTGYISLTTGGVNTGYFSTNGGLVTSDVSLTGTISSTNAYTGKLRLGNTTAITNAISPFQSYADIVGSFSGLAGMEMRNLDAGPASEFRFVISDERGSAGSTLIASMPASTNTQLLFGIQRNQIASLFTNSNGGRILALGTVANNAIVFGTNNQESARIMPGGLMGIKTLAPSTTLHVNGTLRIADGGESCDTNRIGAIKYTGGSFYGCNGTAWSAFTNASSTVAISSGTSGSIVFRDESGYLKAYSNFTISSTTGSIGIGGSVPTVLSSNSLYTTGQIRAAGVSFGNDLSITRNGGNLYWVDTGTRIEGDATTNKYLAIFTSSTEALRVVSNSYVGIGTSTPATRLDVSGTLRIADGAETCTSTIAGAIRYNGGTFYACNGTAWSALTTASSNVTTDRLVSNTASAILNGTTGTLTVSSTISTTMLNLGTNPATACATGQYGTIKVENGRMYLCRQ